MLRELTISLVVVGLFSFTDHPTTLRGQATSSPDSSVTAPVGENNIPGVEPDQTTRYTSDEPLEGDIIDDTTISSPATHMLDDEELVSLHSFAAEVILAKLEGREPEADDMDAAVFQEERGVFITIWMGDRVRGCRGKLVPDKNLKELVREVALAAALGDPRFKPLTRREFRFTEIELSIVNSVEEADDIESIPPTDCGVFLRKGVRYGVLLPCVIAIRELTGDEIMNTVCRNAGLLPDCRNLEGLEIYTFRTQDIRK